MARLVENIPNEDHIGNILKEENLTVPARMGRDLPARMGRDGRCGPKSEALDEEKDTKTE